MPSRSHLLAHPGVRSALALGVILVAALLLLRGGRIGVAAAQATPATGPCEDGGDPVVWPLGTDGFLPRVLYDGHWQFQHYGAAPSLHQGIDIGGCPDEFVYAVGPGTVVDVWGEGGDYATVVVSDGDDLGHGTMYQHLEMVLVEEKETVQRDQAIGTVRTWSDFTGFDHLHLQRVAAVCDPPASACELWKNAEDDGNPLPRFAPRMDGALPVVRDLGAEVSLPGPLLFYADGDEITPLDPGGLKGAVDIVACVTELFPGTASADCLADSGCDAGFSTEVAPHRLTLCIRRSQSYSDDSSYPRILYETVYRNTIALDDPCPFVEGWEFMPPLYRKDSKGEYTLREPRFVLTHCTDAEGAWDTTSVLDASDPKPVELRVELTVEDTSGNVAVATMDVTVVP